MLALAWMACSGNEGDGDVDPTNGGTDTAQGDDDTDTDSGSDLWEPNVTTDGGAETCVILFGQLDRIRGPDEGLPVGDTGRTLQVWVRSDNPAEQIALAYGRASAGQGFQLGTSSGYPLLRVGTSQTAVISGDVFVGDDEWHHLVASWDGNTAVLVVDGQVAGVGALEADTLEGDLMAGNTPTGDGTKPWIGWLDDAKVIKGPRDPVDVADDPEALAVPPDDVLVWWDFEVDQSYGIGVVVPDLSGHGHDGLSAGLDGTTPLFVPCR
ncbi:MAG: LamG-like jellyroll fold domain-containing protein [Myxococcota bacterium]